LNKGCTGGMPSLGQSHYHRRGVPSGNGERRQNELLSNLGEKGGEEKKKRVSTKGQKRRGGGDRTKKEELVTPALERLG